MAEAEQLIDPNITRSKFDREIAEFKKHQRYHHRRGWLLIEASYPKVFVIFAKPEIHPQAILFGVEIDFKNYDLWPPSVTLVEPFTREPYTNETFPAGIRFPYRVGEDPGQFQDFLQKSELSGGRPFICMPGTREYHEHPAHTGNSWLLHRGRGAGTLFFLLNKLYEHGVQPVAAWNVNLNVQIGPPQLDAARVPQ